MYDFGTLTFLSLLVGYHGEPKVNLSQKYKDYIGVLLPQKVKGYLLYYQAIGFRVPGPGLI